MNILNRIKKLESKTGNNDLNFCDCFMTHMRKLAAEIYDGAAYDETKAFLPEGNYCPKCKKPVSDGTIKAQKDLILIYGDL